MQIVLGCAWQLVHIPCFSRVSEPTAIHILVRLYVLFPSAESVSTGLVVSQSSAVYVSDCCNFQVCWTWFKTTEMCI